MEKVYPNADFYDAKELTCLKKCLKKCFKKCLKLTFVAFLCLHSGVMSNVV